MSRRTATWLAFLIWALSAALVALTLLLDLHTPSGSETDESALWDVLFVVLIMTYTTVGAFVASRRPGNAIGWIFCGAGLFYAFDSGVKAYADYARFAETGLANVAKYFAWLSDSLAIVVLILATLLLLLLFPSGRLPSGLLFPEGTLPSRSWQAVVWLAVGASAIAALSLVSDPNPTGVRSPSNNPLGIGGTVGDAVQYGGFVSVFLLIVSALFAGASFVSRLVLTRGQERQQLKWFAYAAAMIIGGILAVAFGAFETGMIVTMLGFVLLPVATAIAILKYRLYDIDRIINRTLVYGALTAVLALVYFGGVTATQAIFHTLTDQEDLPQLAIVVSTLVIAALFNPLRRRIQGFIDRRFYRRKYDARKTLEAFSAKLREETDLDALNAELVGVVRETMQPAHVSLWLRPDTAASKKEEAAS